MSSNTASIASSAGKCLLTTTLSLLLVASHPALAGESVVFPSLDGPLTVGKPTSLHGLLMKPDGIGPFPAIVALHGCNGLFEQGGGPGCARGGLGAAADLAWIRRLVSRQFRPAPSPSIQRGA